MFISKGSRDIVEYWGIVDPKKKLEFTTKVFLRVLSILIYTI